MNHLEVVVGGTFATGASHISGLGCMGTLFGRIPFTCKWLGCMGTLFGRVPFTCKGAGLHGDIVWKGPVHM